MHELTILLHSLVNIILAIFHWFQEVLGVNIGISGHTPRWYNFHSGWEGDIAIYAAVIAFYWHHQCHQDRCYRWARHTTADGTKVCKTHHPDMGKGFKITAKHILHHHKLHVRAKGVKK